MLIEFFIYAIIDDNQNFRAGKGLGDHFTSISFYRLRNGEPRG